jgi:hypothetical protein
VIGLAVLAQGCAGAMGAKQPVVIPGAIPPARPLAPLANGRFVVTKGRPGIVIAAPHGTSDSNTDVLGRDLAQLTGWSLVVVTGFSNVDGARRRLNVNRQKYMRRDQDTDRLVFHVRGGGFSSQTVFLGGF